MGLRSPHGTARQRGAPGPRVEVMPATELPDPVPTEFSSQLRIKGRPRGRPFAKGNNAAPGGQRLSLVASLGLGDLEATPEFKKFVKKASHFRRLHEMELAAMAGGECGMGPASMVATASLQLAGSRYLFLLAGRQTDQELALKLFSKASALGDSSRQNLLAAYELAVKAAKARQGSKPADPLGLPPAGESRRRGRGSVSGSSDDLGRQSLTVEGTAEEISIDAGKAR